MGRIFIQGGQWKGRGLSTPSGQQVRPTPIRLRQTLFDWLGHDLSDLRCLDLFAGSGALGLEALSRGAAHVTFIEKSRPTFMQVRKNIFSLHADKISNILCCDALTYLSSINKDQFCYDIVFLDPPFGDQTLLASTLELLNQKAAVGSVLYIEFGQEVPTSGNWLCVKHKKVSNVFAHLWERHE